MHETLYHFHEPKDEAEANDWLLNFLARYNDMDHRSEPHSRLQDWLENLPAGGVRSMCSWERFCTFAREPERRRVGPDARVPVGGTRYEVDPQLAGEEVLLWWGLFDSELYVEHGEKRFGPYTPVGGPIPLHHYRSFKKTRAQSRADRIDALAAQLAVPKAALTSYPTLTHPINPTEIPTSTFADPDPFHEITFPNALAAKRAVATYLGLPLAKLPAAQLAAINTIVDGTLDKKSVIARVREVIQPSTEERRHVE